MFNDLDVDSHWWAFRFRIGDCPRDVWKNMVFASQSMLPLQQSSLLNPVEPEELLNQSNVPVLCFVIVTDLKKGGLDLVTSSQGDRMTAEMQVRQLSSDLQHARAVALDEPATLEAHNGRS